MPDKAMERVLPWIASMSISIWEAKRFLREKLFQRFLRLLVRLGQCLEVPGVGGVVPQTLLGRGSIDLS